MSDKPPSDEPLTPREQAVMMVQSTFHNLLLACEYTHAFVDRCDAEFSRLARSNSAKATPEAREAAHEKLKKAKADRLRAEDDIWAFVKARIPALQEPQESSEGE